MTGVGTWYSSIMSAHYDEQFVYVLQLSMAIKSVGVHQRDGSVCTTFRKLQRETESLFPDFVGTLMAAKRYHVRFIITLLLLCMFVIILC